MVSIAAAQRDNLIYKGPEQLLRFAPDAATAMDLAEHLHDEAQAQHDASKPAMRPGAFFLGGAKVVKESKTWKYNRYLGARRGFFTGLLAGATAVLILQKLSKSA
jgi:hypothetical protein